MSRYNEAITHPEYDTFRNVHIIELKKSLDDLVVDAIHELQMWFKFEVEQKRINESDEENVDDLIEYLNHNGDLDQIIDGCVPIYTNELKGLFFINETALIEAFENMGLGNRSDFESGPLGFEGVSIYCYIENSVNEWLNGNFEEWFSTKFWEVIA